MSEPFLGEVKVVAFNFAPQGWAMCNGQLLSINQNQALFSLLGTTYGGDGRTTFALPNLQGRVPVYVGNGILLGQAAGEQTHTLLTSEMPSHTHVPRGDSANATTNDPTNHAWATVGGSGYATAQNGAMQPTTIGVAGNGQPHDNMQPYLVLTFIIALQGIFPSRN